MSTEAGRGRDDDSLAAAAPSALTVALTSKSLQPPNALQPPSLAAVPGPSQSLHHGFQVEVLGTRRPALVMRAGEDGGEYRGEDNG